MRQQANGSSWGSKSFILIAVKSIKISVTVTDNTVKMSISRFGISLVTSCAYSVAASASAVSGKE